MLSVETKKNRINEKLNILGVNFEFGCFDLKTYSPMLGRIGSYKGLYPIIEGFSVHMGYEVQNNIVIFYAQRIGGEPINNYADYDRYISLVKAVNDIIKYCNSLQIEIPKYKS